MKPCIGCNLTRKRFWHLTYNWTLLLYILPWEWNRLRRPENLKPWPKKIYLVSCTVTKMKMYMNYFSAYTFNFAMQLSQLIQKLSLQDQPAAILLTQKLPRVSKQQISTVLHTTTCMFQILATSMALCHHSWLHSTTLQTDIKMHIEDVAFDGLGVFNTFMDDTPAWMDDNHKWSKNLDLSWAISQKPFLLKQ